MAKVSLRIYNREIESLIDQGHTEEAVSHCHHILKTFPKHLETYRLLGKAHLEAKRYMEAVDIFSRVLMAAPEDFVAHVGMSIISDEQHKLDDAIWHMERAFETQPSNAAIQGELQRLYGRRDGMEPPKIRMTRGALAFMYVQGELYPQAVAEIHAVLDDDPNRGDMRILLARAYHRSGQKADATDMCAQLLKQYPYCLDANRIMVDLIPSRAGAAESTEVYRTRVFELDPYASFTKGSIFLSNEIPDAAVNLERLEYTGSDVQLSQEWGSSLGIGLGSAAASSSEQPDWLRSGGVSDFSNQSQPVPASASEAEDEIPDFLRAAGWGESNTPEQPTSIFDQDSSSDESLVPADLPDWLKGQAPVTEPLHPVQQAPAQSLDTPDWLSEMSSEQAVDSAAPQSTDISDWLSSLDDAQDVKESPAVPAGDIPDWLSGLSDAATTPETEAPQAASDTPEWLGGLGTAAAAAAAADAFEAEPAQPGDVPDWLSGLGDAKASEPMAAQSSDIPEWLNGMDDLQPITPVSAKTTEPSVDELGTSAQEQDDAVAWLESLAAKHGAKPEEMVTDPNLRSETPPDWVQQAQTLNQQPSVENLGTSAQEQDDAVAWLESLAAKHGAKPEEMVSDPNKRSETPPEWVQQAQAVGEAESISSAKDISQKPDEQIFSEFDTTSIIPTEADATGMWLRDLDKKEKESEFITPSADHAQDVPEWLKDIQSQPEQMEETSLKQADIPDWIKSAQPVDSDDQIKFVEDTPAAQNSDLPDWLSGIEDESPVKETAGDQGLPNNDLSNWLSGLDEEPGLPFESMPTPNSILADSMPRPVESPVQQEPVAAKADLPDWLSDVDAKPEEDLEEDLWKKSIEQEVETIASQPTDEPAPVTETVDLPDWLQGVEVESDKAAEIAEVEMEGDDSPPWMVREKFEAEELLQPIPTSPSEWHPVDMIETKPIRIQREEEIPAAVLEPALAAPSEPAPATKKKTGLSVRQAQPEAQNITEILAQAKGELDRGDIPTALNHYGKLIKKGKHLEEAIRDLSESLYRYPVEVGIWQTLGDAYMRSNRLKEALEAYNKAEELIR
ncbi:MAG: tetratricopeptide repeat protein [Chloroflexi bacterium]|nr:tetratricopeptide repeat protein [Chloroflexota bacterium]